MKIRLGVYELFSRIVPGGLYIAAAIQLAVILGLSTINMDIINNLSLITSIGLVVCTYVIGGALDYLALVWFRIFEKRGVHARIFARFKKSYEGRWEINFNGDDWPILLAYIRTRDLDLADEVDRHNAVSIMLRNVSLGLVFLGINGLIQFFFVSNGLYILASVVLFGISYLTIREAKKFREWWYDAIFQTTLAYRMELENIIKPAHKRSGRKSDKKDE